MDIHHCFYYRSTIVAATIIAVLLAAPCPRFATPFVASTGCTASSGSAGTATAADSISLKLIGPNKLRFNHYCCCNNTKAVRSTFDHTSPSAAVARSAECCKIASAGTSC